MENRTISLGEIWAAGAPNPVANPIAGVTYANKSITKEQVNDGWPFGVTVDSANFNEIMQRMTTLLLLLEQNGILPWSALTPYIIGGRSLGNNGIIYKASQDSVGKDPILFPDYWDTDNGLLNFGVATGGSNAYAAVVPQRLAAYVPGLPIFFQANFTNTGAATLSVNGLAPAALKRNGATALSAGDIQSGQILVAVFDGTVFQIFGGLLAYISDLAAHNASTGAHMDLRTLNRYPTIVTGTLAGAGVLNLNLPSSGVWEVVAWFRMQQSEFQPLLFTINSVLVDSTPNLGDYSGNSYISLFGGAQVTVNQATLIVIEASGAYEYPTSRRIFATATKVG